MTVLPYKLFIVIGLKVQTRNFKRRYSAKNL